MHAKKYAAQLASSEELRLLFDETREAVYKKRVLGSQRALQFGGDPILRRNDKIYNCATTYIDRPNAFNHVMYILLAGCGVGFSVQYHHTNKLPNIHTRTGEKKTFVIPDSIEGWADAVGVAVNSYFAKSDNAFAEYARCPVEFDYSLIRPRGSHISGGFKAPGPDGLKRSIEKIQEVIESRLAQKENRLHPIDCYDVIMHASDAVLSGGVRRSATICLFSINDDEMMRAKTGDWYYTNPQRGRSNNSVALVRDATDLHDFEQIMISVKDFGEPAFVFIDHEDVLVNPCVTGDTLVDSRVNGEEMKLRIDELIKRFNLGENIEVKSQDINSDQIQWKRMSGGAMTRKYAEVIELHLDDGKTLKCTPDHKIYTSNRGYVEAKDLTDEDDIAVDV